MWNGSAWQAASPDIVGDTTPQLGGNLDTNGNDINFGDNDKAVFGAGSDLQIYHDGTQSIIEDVGTGNFRLRTNGLALQIRDSSDLDLANFNNNGSVYLKHVDAGVSTTRLQTTATGADITGTLTADGLTVDGGASASTSYFRFAEYLDGFGYNGAYAEYDGSNNELIFGRHNTSDTNTANDIPVMSFQRETGDVSLYDSTGTTQGFFWDANEVRLGLGTTSPARNLHLYAENSDASVRLQNTANSKVWEINPSIPGVANSGISIVNVTDNTVPMHINNSGSVGIGIAAPSRRLHIVSSDLNIATFEASNGNSIDLGYDSLSASRTGDFFIDNRDASGNNIQYRCGSSASHIFNIGTSEKARLDASGNLLVGNTSNTTSQAGVYLNSNGRFFATHSGSSSIFNRLSTDGDILLFQKDTSTVGSISVTGSGTTYNTTSDLRLKENIEPLVATDKLMAMNPVSYNWKADPDGPRSMGFIAQEMQEVMPEAVSVGDDEDAMMSMDYGRITPILVSALQDAHRKIEELAAEIAELKGAK